MALFFGCQSPEDVFDAGNGSDSVPPTVPGGLSASEITDSSVTISWEPSGDNVAVKAYVLYQDQVQIVTDSLTRQSIEGLLPQTIYTYTVRAVDRAGNISGLSPKITATTLKKPTETDSVQRDTVAPTAPKNLTTTNITHTSTELHWNAATDSVGVTAYRVYQDTLPLASVPDTTYLVSNLTSGMEYNFSVSAIDASENESVLSNVVELTTMAVDTVQRETIPPPRPTNLAVTDSSQTSVGLVWQAVADSVGAVTYRVYQDSTIITTIAETQFEVIDLIPATEYAFFVSTIDTVQNESALSEPVAVTTEALEIVANDTVAPTTPANLVAINVTATMVDLSWHTATDRTGVSNYNIYQNASVIATIPETNYQVKGLTKGTSYDFTVSASDAAENESAPSEILVVVAEVESDTVPPTVPVNLFANEITQTTVNLSWDPSTDDSGVANYAVFQDGSVIATVAESNFQVTGLSMGISYDFTISAIDTMENESAPSDTLIVTTESEADTTAPTVPENVIANKVTQTTVNLSWDVSTDDSGVAGYTIFQDGSAVATIEELNYQVTGLSAGLSYDFTVSASDVAENESAPSEILVVVAEVESDTVPPTVPMNVVANEVTQTTVDLSWEASSDDSGVAGYTIFQDGSAVATIGETNYQVIGLSAGTSYGFMITAIDTAENKSENSDVLRVATEAEVDSAPPTVPTNLVVNGVTESMVNLSWNASTDDSGVANYTVFQDGSAIATVTETNYQATGLSAGTNYSFSVSATDTMANGSTQSQAVSVVTQETQQSEPEKLLVFTKTVEFRHGSIAKGVATLASLGAANNFEVVQTENSADFNTQNLQQYQLVVFLNTTGDVLNPTQQSAFESYIQAGGSYMGVHAATDTEYNWPWYGQLVGAYFNGHPDIQQATIDTVNGSHPSTSHLPNNWVRTDEWYNFRDISSRIIPLLNLDENTYTGGTNGSTHPIAWYHEFDGGRSFYTGGGHADSAYDEPDFRQHLLGGIEYCLGRAP